jgi:diguanylate cyclase (GGDEF)-like protein
MISEKPTSHERREKQTPWHLILEKVLENIPNYTKEDEIAKQRWIAVYTELVDKTARRLTRKLGLKEGDQITQEIIETGNNKETVEEFILDTLEIAEINYVLREKVDTEQLTGLLNRQAYAAHFIRERDKMNKEKKDGRVAVLCSVDMDWFKQINDTYGHHVGDMALKATANKLNKKIRSRDAAARIGGDELSFLLTDVPEDKIHEIILEKIQSLTSLRIAEITLDNGSKEYRVVDTDNPEDEKDLVKLIKEGKCNLRERLSFSVSAKTLYPNKETDISLEDALKEIEGGIYMVKDKGRNGVIFMEDNGTNGILYQTDHHSASREDTGLYLKESHEKFENGKKINIAEEIERKPSKESIVKEVETNLNRTLGCVRAKHGNKLTPKVQETIIQLADNIYEECYGCKDC